MNPANLAQHLAAVESWWRALTPADRRTCYRPHEIAAATGVPLSDLPTVTAVLGWHRAQRWTREGGRRKLRTFYSPPGRHVPRVPRGRPSTAAILAPLFGYADPYALPR